MTITARPTRHNYGEIEITLPECTCLITPLCGAKEFKNVVKRIERMEQLENDREPTSREEE